ncbi:MAG: pyrroline-5-carboxylate reductase [Candidatus Margulisiibacteriota bacterium]
MSHTQKLSFIGAGRMTDAIISGIIKADIFLPQNIFISDKDGKRLEELAERFNVEVTRSNTEAVAVSDIVVLAVKPQIQPAVLKEISGTDIKDKLFISIAAGISLAYLESKLNKAPVIRVMPNNPCLVGHGMSVLCKGRYASAGDMEIAEKIFSSLGRTIVMDEKYLDAVTGLSGSGPAFVYSAIAGMINGGELCGISAPLSKQLALQTFLGAVATFIEAGKSAKELIDMVASPGGTTIEGLKILDKYKFEEAMSAAVIAAKKRAREIRMTYEG